jgi:hypothetical protein
MKKTKSKEAKHDDDVLLTIPPVRKKTLVFVLEGDALSAVPAFAPLLSELSLRRASAEVMSCKGNRTKADGNKRGKLASAWRDRPYPTHKLSN